MGMITMTTKSSTEVREKTVFLLYGNLVFMFCIKVPLGHPPDRPPLCRRTIRRENHLMGFKSRFKIRERHELVFEDAVHEPLEL